MDHESKALTLELKADDDAEGAFVATFSRFNVLDHHGDVVERGAFDEGAEVLVGAYMHEMWDLPVGKGLIRSDDDVARLHGQFWLDTTSGLDTYRSVKNAGSIMEWSYIFQIKEQRWGSWTDADGHEHEDVRFISKVDVWSVDPVLRGAGIGTGTDAIKGVQPVPFIEQASALVTALEAFTARAEARLEMRAREHRQLSADDRERMGSLVTGIAELKQRLEEALSAGRTTQDDEEGRRVLLEAHRTLALMGAER